MLCLVYPTKSTPHLSPPLQNAIKEIRVTVNVRRLSEENSKKGMFLVQIIILPTNVSIATMIICDVGLINFVLGTVAPDFF